MPYFKNKNNVSEASHLTILHQAGLRKTAVWFRNGASPFLHGEVAPSIYNRYACALADGPVGWLGFDVDIPVSLMDSGSKIAVIP